MMQNRPTRLRALLMSVIGALLRRMLIAVLDLRRPASLGKIPQILQTVGRFAEVHAPPFRYYLLLAAMLRGKGVGVAFG